MVLLLEFSFYVVKKNLFSYFLSGNIWLELEPEQESEQESEPKFNNFGTATLLDTRELDFPVPVGA